MVGIEDFLTPEVMAAIVTLMLAIMAYLTAKLRELVNHETEWKAEEDAAKAAASVATSGSVALTESEYQTPEGMKKMIEAIPKGATILKVDEGVASNGSKYRVVYWTT